MSTLCNTYWCDQKLDQKFIYHFVVNMTGVGLDGSVIIKRLFKEARWDAVYYIHLAQ